MTPQWTRETEDRVVRAVLQDRAHRWGFDKHLKDDELDRWVKLQEHSKNIRADVRAMLTALSNAGRLERDATIMLTVESEGRCEWPYPFDHAHEDGKCVAPPAHGGIE